MQLLASPIVWLFLALFYFFFKSDGEKATDLSIFSNTSQATTDSKGNVIPNKVVTASGVTVVGATINVAKAKVLSGRLVELFGQYLSSEKEILDVFKGLNYSDFMLIYDQFGTNHVRSYFGNVGFGSDGEDLIEWLTKEVTSTSNFNKLKKQFPTIF